MEAFCMNAARKFSMVLMVGIAAAMYVTHFRQPVSVMVCARHEFNAFECEIEKLLQVSADDTFRGEGSAPLNIEGRKKFFSEEGWRQYQAYIASQKKYLKSMPSRDNGTPWHNRADFEKDSQTYETEKDGLKTFS